MTKGRRIILFTGILGFLGIIYWQYQANINSLGPPGIVILSTLVMLAFVTLILEHFFTKPTDVIANNIAILLLLAPLHLILTRFGVWYPILISYNLVTLGTATVALLLLDKDKPPDSLQNRTSNELNRFCTFFGNGKFLWFALFALSLLFYVDSQSSLFLLLFGFASVILLIDPSKYAWSIGIRQKIKTNSLGEIIGVQSTNTFLARLFEQHPAVERFDLVEFRYTKDNKLDPRIGIVTDAYMLDQQQWVRILSDSTIRSEINFTRADHAYQPNIVYLANDQSGHAIKDRLVGSVCESSSIEKIRFEYAFQVSVSEGDLVEVRVGTQKVMYQVVEGITSTESLESKNEAGQIIGDAIQLGVWSSERRTFERFGWVPRMNSPLLLADDIEKPKPVGSEFEIGCIPNTNYPVFINRDDAITHHLAVLGVTGTGKSVFTRNLIRNIVGNDTKVICVDFTNEYRSRLTDLGLHAIISRADQDAAFKAVDDLSVELAKFANQRSQTEIDRCEGVLKTQFGDAIEAFLISEDHAALFELPDVSNTTGILEYTRWFFKALFDIAKSKENFGRRVCVVLEEAHTVIPEWNFIGIDDKRAGALVNSIGQIALQGRKYNVGFIIVAQRTANVSKTVLTQCNSVIAFQQFDKTASDFLGNYMSSEFTDALTRLKPRHAIAVGKAFPGGIPVILEVPDIAEPAGNGGPEEGGEDPDDDEAWLQ